MAVPEQYIQVTTAHQVYIERVKTGLQNEYLKTVEENRKLVKSAIYDLDVDKISDLSKTELNALIKDLEAKQLANYETATGAFLVSLEDFSSQEIDFETEALNKVTKTNRFNSPKPNTAISKYLARPIAADGLEGQVKPEMTKFAQVQAERVSQSLRQSWGNKLSTTEAVKILATMQNGKVISGSFKTTANSTKSTIRTITQHVSTVTNEAVYSNNSSVIEGYEIVVTLDNRTGSICRNLPPNKIYPIGDGPLPPLHYHCRSTIAPSLSSEFDYLNKDATRSAKFGPVDADLSYYAWLKQQSSAFQDSVIGSTRGKLLRDGGLNSTQFASLNLNRNFEPMTLAEMRIKNPLAFTNAGL